MGEIQSYELLVIGSGPGGYTAAIKAAKLDMSVAVIEKNEIGGNYTNLGCVPTRAMLHSARVYADLCQGSQFGIRAEQVTLDFAGMKEYWNNTAEAYQKQICQEFEQWKIPVYSGKAQIHEGHMVSVGTMMLHGDHILIATGTKPAALSKEIMGLPGVYDIRGLLQAERWDFKSVLIIGGGLVGTEYATIFNSLGIQATVLERADCLLAAMGEEVSHFLQENMEANGITIHTGVYETSVERREDGLHCTYMEKGKEKEVITECVLVASGREADLEDLFDTDMLPRLVLNNGAPVLKGNFQTSIPGIYAVGDVLQRTQLAHTAAAQATYLVESLSGVQPTLMLSSVPAGMYVNLPIIPNCIYTRPEIACVGLTEAQALRAGCQIRCGVYTMEDNGQAIITRQAKGLIKLVFALPGKILIGAQIICPRATDMIGEMATAIANGLTARKLMLAMRAHPTYGEGITKAVENSGLL